MNKKYMVLAQKRENGVMVRNLQLGLNEDSHT